MGEQNLLSCRGHVEERDAVQRDQTARSEAHEHEIAYSIHHVSGVVKRRVANGE